MSADEQERRLMELEILVNNLAKLLDDLKEKHAKTEADHKASCPFFHYKEEFFREITKVELYTKEKIQETNRHVDNTKASFWKIMSIFGGSVVLVLTMIYSLASEKVSVDAFQESITIINKTQERQIEIYEHLLDDLNRVKIDVGIIKNQLELQSREGNKK